MVIGYDVHHKKRTKSVMAFNATMDRDYCRYWSRSCEQEENQEYCTNLQQTITEAIN